MFKSHRRIPSATIAGARVQLKTDNKLCRGSPPLIFVLICLLCSAWIVIDYWKAQAYVLASLRTMNFRVDSRPVVIWSSPARNASARGKPDKVAKGTAVYYVGVHKAASTTARMILNRYGVKHELKFASYNVPQGAPFPKTATGDLLYVSPKKQDFSNIDIIHEYTVYSEAAVRPYMRPGYKLIGSLREPLNQLRSLMESLDLAMQMDITANQDPVEAFLRNPELYEGKPGFERLQNSQAQHYGFDLSYKNNESSFLEFVDEKFDMILITDRLDESLLLMKRKFGWTLNDIMYIPRKITPASTRLATSQERESVVVEWHRFYSKADYMMHDYFSRKLQSELDEQPNEFWQQLLNYKNIKEKFRSFCQSMCVVIQGVGDLNATQVERLLDSTVFYVPGIYGEDDMTLRYSDCVLLTISPTRWQLAIKVNQFPELFCSTKTLSLSDDASYFDPTLNRVVEDKQGAPKSILANDCKLKNEDLHIIPHGSLNHGLFTNRGDETKDEQPFCTIV